MATWLRATVMLVVLVGLPATWVYYGPLPPEAMGVIQRTIASAKHLFGWETQPASAAWPGETLKTAPRFDESLAEATRTLQQQPIVEQSDLPRTPQTPVTRDPQFSLASAELPVENPAPPKNLDSELARQLEPHLSLLRSLDAADYSLENWGGQGQLYRFRCSIALGESDDHVRHFESINADPLHAVHQVVGEVTAWQNARQTGHTSRWQ